jgi:putative FmdB family regulatory protein
MPIYDYRCDHCGHAFSAVQSFNDEALGACPNCGKRPRRLLSKPAIVFKGSGWYKTDSRGPAPADTTSSTAKDGAGGGEAAEKKATPAATETTTEKSPASSSG